MRLEGVNYAKGLAVVLVSPIRASTSVIVHQNFVILRHSIHEDIINTPMLSWGVWGPSATPRVDRGEASRAAWVLPREDASDPPITIHGMPGVPAATLSPLVALDQIAELWKVTHCRARSCPAARTGLPLHCCAYRHHARHPDRYVLKSTHCRPVAFTRAPRSDQPSSGNCSTQSRIIGYRTSQGGCEGEEGQRAGEGRWDSTVDS